MSSHIRVRKHKVNQLATLVTLAFPAAAIAQTVTLPEVKVEAQAESYKVERLSSTKQTQPILDIPQVVNVVKKEMLLEQGATTLMEALRNTPGITQQLGENGNTSAGDTFQMRGFSTQASTFVDGVRDLGAVTRDVFNLEQVEIVKGPSGGDIGRGASSGYINLVTKQANLENATSGSLSWNTGNNSRATVDMNRKVGDTSGFRLNAMVQGGGVAGRNEVENNSFAIAPSFVTGLGTPTRVYLSGQFIRQDNVPDGGIPAVGISGYNAATSTNTPLTTGQINAINAAPGVSTKNYYGSYNDYEKVTADMVTARIEHDLSSNTTLRNITRVGRTEMDRLLSSPNALASGNLTSLSNPQAWTVNISRQRIRQENEVFVNQTALTTELELAGMKHSFAYGLELMHESQFTPGYATTTYSGQSLYAPSAALVMNSPAQSRAYTNGKTTTVGAYFFDTIELSKKWLFNAGVRLDRYHTDTHSMTEVTTNNASNYPGYTAGQYVNASQSKSDLLTSWKLGLVHKPASNGSVYVAAANSMLPPGGGSFNLAPAINSANNPGMDPQETLSYEMGTKWDVLNKRLNLSAAVYRMIAKNELTRATDDPTVYSATGERLIRGIELGAVGRLTDDWQVSAGIATLDTEITKGTTGNSAAGAVTRWSPDLTATLWTTYNLGDKWSFGGGARYVSEQKRVIDPTANLATQNGLASIPSYSVYDAMVSYKVDKNVTVRLNVYNLTDKFYINTLNNGGTRVGLGTPRSATITASFQF